MYLLGLGLRRAGALQCFHPAFHGLPIHRHEGDSMIFPQLFHILIQHMGWEPAQLHPSHAADRPGGEGQPQQGGGGFGILAVQLKEVAHLIQDEAVRVGLPDLVQLIPPGGAGAFLLLGHGGLRYWRGGFGGGGFAGLRGRCGKQVKRNLSIIALCH